MKAFQVFRTEALSNARERRTLASALLVGPLMGPVLFGAATSATVERATQQAAEVVEVPMVGVEGAPHFVQFLRQHDIVPLLPSPSDFEALKAGVTDGRFVAGLALRPNAFDSMREGKPVGVRLVFDQSEPRHGGARRRLRRALSAYEHFVREQRLTLRGLSPVMTRAVIVDEVDVSTPTGRAEILLAPVTFLLLLATLMGGIYLAIDATAGERERGSLEPLLALPVARRDLVLGKVAATALYMLVSLSVTVLTFSVTLEWLPLDRLDMSARLGFGSMAALVGLMVPFAVMGAALLTVVAASARTYREAQSWVGVLILLPTVPVMFANFADLQPTPGLAAVPSLGQHLLMSSLLRGEPLDPSFVAASLVGTGGCAAVLTALAIWLFRRERILG